METLIAWTEIPAADVERAAKFYGALYGQQFKIIDDGPRRYFVLPAVEGSSGASVNQTANFEPNPNGVLVYLFFDGKLDETLEKVESAGGKVVIPRTNMGENGVYATFNDTEGNTLALWSMT